MKCSHTVRPLFGKLTMKTNPYSKKYKQFILTNDIYIAKTYLYNKTFILLVPNEIKALMIQTLNLQLHLYLANLQNKP